MQTAFYSRVDREYQRISYRSILYIIAKNNYSVIVTIKGQKLCIYATLSRLEDRLPKKLFARVHRSYIVSLNRIGSFSRNCITMKGEVIPVSKDYYEILHGRLNIICNEACLERSNKTGKANDKTILEKHLPAINGY